MTLRGRLRPIVSATAVACAFAWTHTSSAKPPPPPPPPPLKIDVETAEQLYAKLDYDKANEVVEKVLKLRGLSHDQLVRAYRVLAVTHAVLDHEEDARDAFIVLLTLDPEYKADPNLGPRVTAPFQEARGYWRAQPMKPGLEVTVVVRVGEGGVVRVTTRDPTKIARKVAVGYRWASSGDYTTQSVPIAEGVTIDVPSPPADRTRLDYYVQATDDRDGVVFEVGSPAVPKSAFAEAKSVGGGKQKDEGSSVFSSPLFWGITAAALLGGGAVAFFALRPKDQDPPTSATLAPTLNCGFGTKCN